MFILGNILKHVLQHTNTYTEETILSSILFWLEIVDSKVHTNDYIISCTSFIHLAVPSGFVD